jgi:hypothetical protein
MSFSGNIVHLVWFGGMPPDFCCLQSIAESTANNASEFRPVVWLDNCSWEKVNDKIKALEETSDRFSVEIGRKGFVVIPNQPSTEMLLSPDQLSLDQLSSGQKEISDYLGQSNSKQMRVEGNSECSVLFVNFQALIEKMYSKQQTLELYNHVISMLVEHKHYAYAKDISTPAIIRIFGGMFMDWDFNISHLPKNRDSVYQSMVNAIRTGGKSSTDTAIEDQELKYLNNRVFKGVVGFGDGRTNPELYCLFHPFLPANFEPKEIAIRIVGSAVPLSIGEVKKRLDAEFKNWHEKYIRTQKTLQEEQGLYKLINTDEQLLKEITRFRLIGSIPEHMINSFIDGLIDVSYNKEEELAWLGPGRPGHRDSTLASASYESRDVVESLRSPWEYRGLFGFFYRKLWQSIDFNRPVNNSMCLKGAAWGGEHVRYMFNGIEPARYSSLKMTGNHISVGLSKKAINGVTLFQKNIREKIEARKASDPSGIKESGVSQPPVKKYKPNIHQGFYRILEHAGSVENKGKETKAKEPSSPD